MGILDAPAQATPGQFATLTSRLLNGSEDSVWLIVGDSTGNDTNEWAYLTAQWLGTQFPAVTVKYRLWNDTNQNYDAAQTLHTGTGPRTLTIYNCSVPGAPSSYPLTRMAVIAPVAPHLITVNYGHNDGGPSVIAQRINFFSLTRVLQDWFPTAGIVLTAQNPRATTDPTYAAGQIRQQATVDLCASEGYGLINVMQAFMDNPTYAADWLNADGLHPNSAGGARWASIVQRMFTRAILAQPRTATPRATRVFIPASSFAACEGSPVYAAAGASGVVYPAWAFDPTTQQGVSALVDWPDSWKAVNVYVVWSHATGTGLTGSTNSVVWGAGFGRFPFTAGQPFSSPSGSAGLGLPNAFQEITVAGTAFNSGAWATSLTRVQSGATPTPQPMPLRIRRIAANASDTLAESAYLRGVYIERAA